MECRTSSTVLDEGSIHTWSQPQGSRAKRRERNWILVTSFEPLDRATPEGLPLGCSHTGTNKFPFLRSGFLLPAIDRALTAG